MRKIKSLGMAVIIGALTLAFIPSLAAQDSNALTDVLTGIKADTPWGIVTVDGAYEFWVIEAATFIDARTPGEYDAGHIPGAINVPLEEIPDSLDKLPADRDMLIVVYCKSGWRASMGMFTMRLLGYANTKGFNGSWLAWLDAEHPVNTGSNP